MCLFTLSYPKITKIFLRILPMLMTVAVVKYADSRVLKLTTIINSQAHIALNKAHTYFDVYNSSTRPVDHEALGVSILSIRYLDPGC